MVFIFENLLLVFLLCLLSWTYWLGRRGSKDLSGAEGLPKGTEMKPFLFLKMFYINADDPRGWLPKMKPSWGWTVNFRSKANVYVFIFLLLGTLASALAMTFYLPEGL